MLQFRKLEMKIKVISALLCILLIAASAAIVYRTGGTEFAFTHTMYIPIVLAGFLFGIKGSASAALAGGLALGPWMPMNVAEETMQTPGSWLIRTVFFLSMALVVGYLFHHIQKDHERELRKSYEHFATGYPNSNKLRLDLEQQIQKQKEITLTIFKIDNLSYINKYVDDSMEKRTVFKVLDILSEYFPKDQTYCITMNKFVTVGNRGIEDTYQKVEEFLHRFIEPIHIGDLPVDLFIKSGIVNYPLHSSDANDLMRKLSRTLDQDQDPSTETSISIYESTIAKQNREDYEIMLSLYEAIKNDEFKLVYQPKIRLKTNEVMGVEALLRWNSRTKGFVSPERFIGMAEYSGMIVEITKWVIRNTIEQLRDWKKEGMQIKTAVNISSKDLKDESIIEYTRELLEENDIDPGLLEFELTERTFLDNEVNAGKLLDEISELGLKISLDDFGTGYNSLINLVKLPVDYVKLDHFMISSINDRQNRPLVEGVIRTAHTLGKEIIAEGVETEEQVRLLNRMGCDNIQGYYFSKPLPPEKVCSFIRGFGQAGAVI